MSRGSAPDLVVYADGPDGPLPEPGWVLGAAGMDVANAALALGWVVRRPPWIDRSPVPVTTVMVGAGTRRAVAEGWVRPVPIRLSAVPRLVSGRLRPAVAVVGAWESGDGWVAAGSLGWAPAAVRSAGAVVVERWPGPAPAGRPLLPPGRVVHVYDRADPPDPPQENRLGPEHQRIGRLVAALVPDGATVQWGPGSVGAAAVAALDRPVRVRSGVVTDELVGLEARGLLAGPAEAAYLWGGRDLSDLVAAGRVVLREIDYTHDLTDLSGTPRFVAINTALQVGLDGSANVEVSGGRIVSGPGGHPDYAAAAARSPGGLSIVALPSTAGGRSSIVARPEVVTTPRFDVDVVVTEHGVADLRGCSDEERAARVILVAAPEHRDALRAPS